MLPKHGRTTGLRGKAAPEMHQKPRPQKSRTRGTAVSTREAQVHTDASDKPADSGLGNSHSHVRPLAEAALSIF